MRYFRKLDIPWVAAACHALRAELRTHEDAWLINQNRQKTVKVQENTQSIFLRSARVPTGNTIKLEDVHESEPSALAKMFPVSMRFVGELHNALGGELGRALYARLLPGAIVHPHIDQGSYYAIRDRYHVVITSKGGSIMKSGNEEVLMQEGEIWWFDNHAMHESANLSSEWRTHLIFDILPSSRLKRL